MKVLLSPGTFAIMDLSCHGDVLSDIVGVSWFNNVPEGVSAGGDSKERAHLGAGGTNVHKARINNFYYCLFNIKFKFQIYLFPNNKLLKS